MTDQKLPATVDANDKRRIRNDKRRIRNDKRRIRNDKRRIREDLIELRGRVTERLERIDAPGYTMTDADRQEDADILRVLSDLELRQERLTAAAEPSDA